MAEKSNVLVRQVPQWMTKDVKPEQPSVDDLEKRFADLERRHDKTRKFLVDLLANIAIVSTCIYFQPSLLGGIAIIIVGNLFLSSIIEQWFLKD
jgi:hypothetical protein